jgi:hypothetical protein
LAIRFGASISKEKNAMGSIDIVTVDGDPNRIGPLFVIFLFIAVCIVLARIFELVSRLWSFRKKRELLGDNITDDAEVIGKAALKGRIRFAAKLSTADIIDGPSILFKVDCIEARFLYFWKTCYAKVKSVKALAGLTAILSFSAAAFNCANICVGIRGEETVPVYAVAGAGWAMFIHLAIGLLVSAFFYAVSLLFEGTLARRRRDWDYLKARFPEEINHTK